MLKNICPLWITEQPNNLKNPNNPANPALARFFRLFGYFGFSVKSRLFGYSGGGRTWKA